MQAIAAILKSTPDIEVAATASDGQQAIDSVRREQFDVVLMDLAMPNVDGVAATRVIRALPNPPQVVALTSWQADDAVINVVQAGGAGFLLKSNVDPREIISGVRAAAAGEAYFSPQSAKLLVDIVHSESGSRQQAAQTELSKLTGREREVAAELTAGLTNAEIGARLHLSDATIKSHIAAIQTKLGLENRVQIAVLAARAGL